MLGSKALLVFALWVHAGVFAQPQSQSSAAAEVIASLPKCAVRISFAKIAVFHLQSFAKTSQDLMSGYHRHYLAMFIGRHRLRVQELHTAE